MMQAPRNENRKARLKMIAFGLFFGLLGLCTGYFGAKALKNNEMLDMVDPQGPVEKLLFLALAFFAIWLVIALHELGHLLAGWAQGFRLALYTAGFLGVRGTERGPKLYFNRQLSLMGGVAATFPEQVVSGPELRRKFARIVVAGPLTSLVVGIGCLAGVWFLLQQPVSPAPLAIRAGLVFLFTTGFMSSMIFLATSMPIPTNGFMTDGARFLSLRNGGQTGLREEAGLAIASLMGAGKLPGEYPSELLERLTALPPDGLLGLNGYYMAFTHHLDRGELEHALPLAQTVEEHISAAPAGPFRRYYLKDIVFLYAFILKDIEKARSLWAGMEKGAEKDRDAANFRVKAALALQEGEYEKAASLVEAGLKKVGDLPFSGQRRFEEKWLGAIREKIWQAEAAGVPA